MPNTAVAPIPQANDLAALSTVVDAVAAGCSTTSDISAAIGMTNRQGNYYPNAAATLGLVEACDGYDGRQWRLTDAGANFVGLNAAERAAELAEAILTVDGVTTYAETYVDRGVDAVVDAMMTDGVGRGTAQRRASTIAAWVTWAFEDTDKQIPLIAGAMTDTRIRTADVLAAARRRPLQQVRPQRCNDCFLELALDGGPCQMCN